MGNLAVSAMWSGPDPDSGAGGGDPISLLEVTHRRMATVCGLLARISDDLWHRGREQNAAVAVAFLEGELPRHLEDEYDVMLPRLRRSSGATSIAQALMDNLGKRMRHDHERTRHFVRRTLPGLRAVAVGSVPDRPAAFAVELICLEQQLRAHIRWEEAMVYPLARDNFSVEDRAHVSRMLTRSTACLSVSRDRGCGPGRGEEEAS